MRESTVSTLLSRRITRRSFSAGALAASGLALASAGGQVALAGAGGGTSVTVTADALNVRDRAGLAGNVIGVELYGAHGVATGNMVDADGYTWYEVNYDDDTSGWSAGEYLQGVGGNSGGGAIGTRFPVSSRVKVMTDALNVRDAAGLDSNVIGVVTYGAVGETFASVMDADGYVWTEVRFPDATGWVAAFYLAEASGGSGGTGDNVAIGDRIKVVDGPLNIRSGPGTGYGVIDMAATGAVAQVIDGPSGADGYTWVKIDGNLLDIGWVAFEFCQAI
jgi:uncharacterized protein YraI